MSTTVNTLITYGGGEILSKIFNAIAAGVGDDAYQTVLRLVGLVALIWVITEAAITTNYVKLLHWLAGFYILLNVLLVPKMTVVIEDKLVHDAVYTVDNVPVGVGYFAVLSSQIGYVLTSLTDEVFSLPDDLQYSQTGLVMGARLVSDAMRFQITDATFSANITSFMQQCVFYDLLLGKYSATDLFTTTDLWGFITTNASPARAFKYTPVGGGNSTIYTCADGVSQLNSDWNTEINQAATIFGQRFFGTHNTDAKSELLSRLPIALNFLTQTSQSAQGIMMQAMTANAISSALLNNSAQVGASAAVGQYASTRAEQMQVSKFLVTGDLAAHWLAIMQNVIQALLYGGFIIVVLTMLLPHGHRVVLHYLQSIIWVQLWSPLYAILNLVMMLGAGRQSMASIANVSGAGSMFTLNTYAGLGKVNADMSAFAGFATMSIPLIAWGLVKFTSLAVTSLASNFASVGQSVAGRVGDEISSGNLSFGNVQYGTQSAFNTSANHFNTNSSFQSGMSAYQAPSGAMVQHAQDGTTVISSQGAISSTGTSINLADSMRTQASLQADKATTLAQTQAASFSASMGAMLRHIQDVSQSVGKGSSSDHSSTLSQSDSVAQSADMVSQTVDRFATDHHLSQDAAAKVLGEAYAKASVGLGVGQFLGAGVGGGVTLSGSGSVAQGHTWRDAMDTVNQESFRHNVDNVVRASQDSHYRSSNDESSRALAGVANSFEAGSSFKQDAGINLSQAESFRQTASFAQDNALSINTNNSQAFVDWLMTQPNGAGGQLGSVGAEQVLNGNPQAAMTYANQFVAGQVAQMSQQFSSGHVSRATLSQGYAAGANAMNTSSQAGMAQQITSGEQMVDAAAKSSGVSTSGVNANVANQVNTAMQNATTERSTMQASTQEKINIVNQDKHKVDGDAPLLEQAKQVTKDNKL